MFRVLLLITFAYFNNANVLKMPIPTFEAYRPSGIRVTLPHVKGVSEFFFWANINVALEGKDLGEIRLSTYEETNGLWVIEDMDVKLKPGDTIYYTFFVNINSTVHRYERQQYTVKEIIERPSTTSEPVTTSTSTTEPPVSTTHMPITTPTTEQPVRRKCPRDDVVQVIIGKEYTTIMETDAKGKEVSRTIKSQCGKALIINMDDGGIGF